MFKFEDSLVQCALRMKGEVKLVSAYLENNT